MVQQNILDHKLQNSIGRWQESSKMGQQDLWLYSEAINHIISSYTELAEGKGKVQCDIFDIIEHKMLCKMHKLQQERVITIIDQIKEWRINTEKYYRVFQTILLTKYVLEDQYSGYKERREFYCQLFFDTGCEHLVENVRKK